MRRIRSFVVVCTCGKLDAELTPASSIHAFSQLPGHIAIFDQCAYGPVVFDVHGDTWLAKDQPGSRLPSGPCFNACPSDAVVTMSAVKAGNLEKLRTVTKSWLGRLRMGCYMKRVWQSRPMPLVRQTISSLKSCVRWARSTSMKQLGWHIDFTAILGIRVVIPW